ncbi:MAG: M16 family metallopeptidase [Limisphaerales bacterium]
MNGWSVVCRPGAERSRCRAWVGLLLCALLLPVLCRAAVSPPATAPLFPVTELTLTNGLRVLMLEDHNCPLVAVQVWYHVGSANEPPGRHGFAHLFEHMMFRGTDRLGPTDHFDLLHSVGGNCNAFTSFDETCYHETLPEQQLELALWLESERMAFLTVDGAGFTTERKVVEEERRLDLGLPYGEIADKGPPLVFGQHPYGHDPLGTFQDLRQATPAEVHAWWTRWYTPNNATLVIVGDVQPGRVRALCERYFGWIPPVPQAPGEVPALAAWSAPRQVTLDLANAPAPGIGLVWRTVPEGHPDALALDLLATILGGNDPMTAVTGGGNSSRLYRRLVAQDHVAVMAGALRFGLSRAGLFGVGAAVLPLVGNTEKVLPVLRVEVERLRAEGVTEEELEKARNQVQTRLVREAQTVAGKASLVGYAAVVGTGVGELNSRLERLQRLTRADLQRAAQLYLNPEHALVVTVPGSSLWSQLSRLFLGSRKAEEAAPVAFAPETVLRGREGVVRPSDLPVRPPIAEGNSPVPNPAVEEHRLANGLRVLVATNAQTPLVQVMLVLPYGSWAEEKPGAAAMSLSLLSKGTELRDDKALAEELDRYATQMTARADHDDSRIEMTCLQESAPRAFALLAEVVTRPTFPEAPFKTAVAQVTTELRIVENTPTLVADQQFRRRVYPGHPYGRRVSGEAADLAALTRQDLTNFWRRAAQPGKATLIVAGALTDERALALAGTCFAPWQAAAAGDSSPVREPAPPPKPGPTRILLVDWPGASQSELRIGGLGITSRDPDKPLASLVGSYFGGSFGSRLTKAIRVQKGATYGARGGFEASRFTGCFVVHTFTKTPSTADTVRAALAEIRGLVERPPTAEELSLHKRYFLGSAAARFETPEQVASQLAYEALNGLPLDYLQRSLATISSSTAPQCEAFARRRVDPARLVIVVVGDASVVAKDLEAIAPVTVVDREGKEARLPTSRD